MVDEEIKLYQQAQVNNEINEIQETNEDENNAAVDTSGGDIGDVAHV